ncbi:MAG TPA: TetR/AcrR family transcriptional regulator [Lachnospiraceae bacterium]|nr:TetR/AcrR family transcriptional regulator [Lachnospiraceae bacterium]
MGVRSEQKKKRREDILRAGLDLFIRKGYTAATVKDIAEAVGMSVGLLFHYFDSKEALYEELIKYGISGPMGTIAQADMEPIAFFELAAGQIINYIQKDLFAAKMFVLMRQASYSEASPQGVKELFKELDIMTPTIRLIRQGQADGTIRDGDPEALGSAYWCAIQGIAEEYALNPGRPLPDSMWIVDMIRRKKT